MTNKQLVAEAERKIQKILLDLESDSEGPIEVQSVKVYTRNFSSLRVTITLKARPWEEYCL